MYQAENRAPDARLVASNEIREAGPIGKAKETIGYLNEIDSLLVNVRTRLYGSFPQEAPSPEKRGPEPVSLDEMMRYICHCAAGISGDLKNLLSRLD